MEKYFTLIIIILSLAAVYALYRKLRRANPWCRAPYERQQYFLSPAEKDFYDILLNLCGDELTVCPKPAIREILRVKPDVRRDRQKYFNWISQKHVDFVLCDRYTMEIICAVELDDSSHDRSDRRQRDAFMDKAFRKARLPLFHIPCRKNYGEKEIGELYRFLYGGHEKLKLDSDVYDSDDESEEEDIPLCPECGVPMVLRTASKGANQGKQFYGCQNFPDCRCTKPVKQRKKRLP